MVVLFVNENDFCYYRNYLYNHRYKFSYEKEQVNESQYIVSRPDSVRIRQSGRIGNGGVDHYPIHGPARLAFKWRENVKRKCGLIFEFWKIRPQGGTVLLWSRHLLLFLFFKWGKPSKNKKLQ